MDPAKHAKAGGKTIGIMVREMLESCATYDDARHAVLRARLVAPCYLSLAGARAGERSPSARGSDSSRSSCSSRRICLAIARQYGRRHLTAGTPEMVRESVEGYLG